MHPPVASGATIREFRPQRAPPRRDCHPPAGHPGDDLAPGTLNSVLKQAGLTRPKGK
ncbi:MAG TPA: type II toxin-antitoxin system HicA family toxin [Thermoleophilia bacterium]|nr:type II toxin-antitoxin system HicA family toxin [Thermoleophilia bacterium]